MQPEEHNIFRLYGVLEGSGRLGLYSCFSRFQTFQVDFSKRHSAGHEFRQSWSIDDLYNESSDPKHKFTKSFKKPIRVRATRFERSIFVLRAQLQLEYNHVSTCLHRSES